MINELAHQKKALFKVKQFIKKNKRGILLFHDLGSGKTITSLIIIKYFINKNINNKFYIICPKHLFSYWKKEAQKLNIDTDKYIYFVNIFNINEILKFKENKKWIIIIDEAHLLLEYFHNQNISINKLEKLYKKLYSCKFTIYLTGTPIIDNISDLNIFENLCSNKNLLTNDKNLFPEYFIEKKFLILIFNKIYPFIRKYTNQAPYFIIISLTYTFIIIMLELYHDALFDDFHKFISYLKYKNDIFGKYIFLPIKKKIENFIELNEKEIEKEMSNDPEYLNFKKIENNDIHKKKLNESYIKIKKNILFKTKLSYFLKMIFGLYYSLLSILEILRNKYKKNNNFVSFNYSKFLRNIKSIDKYFISYNNENFPKKIIHNVYIYLNKKQTNKIVDATINKKYIIDNCLFNNKILCNLFNTKYDEIPFNIILPISNYFRSKKFEKLYHIIKLYKTNIVISCRYDKNSLQLIEIFLKKKKRKFNILYPDTLDKKQILDNFENNEYDILILHHDIIEGISINKTKALILFDICPKYNIEQQIIGRCIRYNSHKNSINKNIHVFRFITIFKKNILIDYLKKIYDPSQTFEELLNDKNKIKFLTEYKSPDQILHDANQLIKNIYNKL